MRISLDHAKTVRRFDQRGDYLIREGITGVHLYALNRSEVVNDLGPMMVGLKSRTDLKSSLENHGTLGF